MNVRVSSSALTSSLKPSSRPRRCASRWLVRLVGSSVDRFSGVEFPSSVRRRLGRFGGLLDGWFRVVWRFLLVALIWNFHQWRNPSILANSANYHIETGKGCACVLTRWPFSLWMLPGKELERYYFACGIRLTWALVHLVHWVHWALVHWVHWTLLVPFEEYYFWVWHQVEETNMTTEDWFVWSMARRDVTSKQQNIGSYNGSPEEMDVVHNELGFWKCWNWNLQNTPIRKQMLRW